MSNSFIKVKTMSASEWADRPVGMAVSIVNEVTGATNNGESNREDVISLIRAAKLDCVSLDVWKSELPTIKKLLGEAKTGRVLDNLSENCGDGATEITVESWRSIFPPGQDELLWPAE